MAGSPQGLQDFEETLRACIFLGYSLCPWRLKGLYPLEIQVLPGLTSNRSLYELLVIRKIPGFVELGFKQFDAKLNSSRKRNTMLGKKVFIHHASARA